MPHIAFALEGFFPENIGGTEHYVLNLAKELRKKDYQISIIKPTKQKQIHQYQFEGFEVYCFPIHENPTAKELNGLEKPSGIEYFTEILKSLKPDIFHLHSIGRAINADHIKIANKLGIKTLFTAHLGSNFCIRGNLSLFGKIECDGKIKKQRCLACFINQQKNVHPVASQILAFLINKLILNNSASMKFPAFRIVDYKLEQINQLRQFSSLNIALADWLKKIYIINGLIHSYTVKQGIDKKFILSNPIERKHNDKIKLIFVGRMHPLKNIDLLLLALKNLTNQFHFAVVTIPFEKEMVYYQKVKDKFHRLGFVNWSENLNSQQLAEKLEESDILVLPSKYEAAPLVILEAFAKKLPVIGSDYIAIQEMVTHNVNGLLFKNSDADSLKGQLHRLANEPGLLQSLKQNIGPVRTFKEVATEHDGLYSKVLGII